MKTSSDIKYIEKGKILEEEAIGVYSIINKNHKMKQFDFVWFEEDKTPDEPIPEREIKKVSLLALDIWDAISKFQKAYDNWKEFNLDSIIMFN